jgi:hypothetical protein
VLLVVTPEVEKSNFYEDLNALLDSEFDAKKKQDEK